ncbi:MAG: M28 family peptidase, partial [Deltaproteobacteria bacterium]|nr:M28 family peptidase [Deltaproteobacteria bacterium]
MEVRTRLERHVQILAGEIKERNLWQAHALEAAAGYIERTLRELGFAVATQEFQVQGRIAENLEVALRGASLPEEIVLVGGHYDSVYGSPGANDNATGTAAVLEVARLLKERTLPRTVRAVAFVNEEPPFFQTKDMGSRLYAR